MKRCEKEIPEQSWRERERWIGLAAQLYVSEYLVLTGKKKVTPNTVWELLCLEEIPLFPFFPRSMNEKYGLNVFMRKKKTWSGFFFFFFPGLFCFSAGRETEKCLSRWLLFVRCSCLGFKHSGISRKHFWLQNLHHSEVWAETMDILAKGRDFFNGRIEVQRITLTVRVAKCLGSSWRALEILRLHKEVFQQPL